MAAQAQDAGMVAVQRGIHAQGGYFGVLDQAHTVSQPDEKGGNALHQRPVKGHQQNQGHGGEVDQPADDHYPARPGELSVHKGRIPQPQGGGHQHGHQLVGDELHGNAGGADADGHALFVHVIDLHGLSAAGAGGDVAIVEAHQGNIERKGQFDLISLLAQKIVVTQRVKEQIGKPAPRRAQQPPGVQREEGLPGVFQVAVAKGEDTDQRDGHADEEKVDQFADAGLHAGLLSACRAIKRR